MVIEMATNTAPWVNLAISDEEILKLISESSSNIYLHKILLFE